jgi:hypothetical protein
MSLRDEAREIAAQAGFRESWFAVSVIERGMRAALNRVLAGRGTLYLEQFGVRLSQSFGSVILEKEVMTILAELEGEPAARPPTISQAERDKRKPLPLQALLAGRARQAQATTTASTPRGASRFNQGTHRQAAQVNADQEAANEGESQMKTVEGKLVSNVVVVKAPDGQEVSDGYHTFTELYDHRITLFIALGRLMVQGWGDGPWRSKKHSDGSAFDGWFIMGIGSLPGYQITYHLPLSRWDETEFCDTLDLALPWDGHTSADVLARLKKL